MALTSGSHSAPRSPKELEALIDEIVNKAADCDELDWIEWKSALYLSDKATQGTIARHILGMANRRPEEALRHGGGCGYVVIGAEPGNRCGITEIDPSVLDQGVQAYLGSEGPSWEMQYVQDATVSVLVIIAEPPRAGAHIFTLQKDLRVGTPKDKPRDYLAGTVFVRRPGRTIQAQPGDIRALEERYAAPFRREAAYARQILEIARAGQAAEEFDRRRRRLTEMHKLVTSVQFKASPVNNAGYWRCPEQLELQGLLIGIDPPMPECDALGGAATGHEAYVAAILAKREIEAELRRLEAEEAATGE
jgi:hypothetical protein